MRKIKQSWIILLFILSIPLAHAASTISTVQKAYYEWCHAIGSAKGNPEVVVRFYAPHAILLPTLSNDFLVNKNGGLNAYFKKLTSYPDIKCIPQKIVTHVHDDIAVNSGFYTFSYREDNKTKVIPARFTFVYKKISDQWLITVHHSSMMPES